MAVGILALGAAIAAGRYWIQAPCHTAERFVSHMDKGEFSQANAMLFRPQRVERDADGHLTLYIVDQVGTGVTQGVYETGWSHQGAIAFDKATWNDIVNRRRTFRIVPDDPFNYLTTQLTFVVENDRVRIYHNHIDRIYMRWNE
jgi:hypothetical protein